MFWHITIIVVSFSSVVSDWNVNINTWLIYIYIYYFILLFWWVVFAVDCVYKLLCILDCEPDCWLWFGELCFTQYDPLWLTGHWVSRLKQFFIFLQHCTLCLTSGSFGLLNCEMFMIQVCILKIFKLYFARRGSIRCRRWLKVHWSWPTNGWITCGQLTEISGMAADYVEVVCLLVSVDAFACAVWTRIQSCIYALFRSIVLPVAYCSELIHAPPPPPPPTPPHPTPHLTR